MTLRLRFQNSGAMPGGRDSVGLSNGVLTIGRGAENDLPLPDPDRVISKRHCVIEERAGSFVLIDVSTNGTFLNFSPERLGDIPAPLSNGDVISLGRYELVVEIGAPAHAAHGDPFAGIAPPLAPQATTPGQVRDAGPAGDFVGSLNDPAGADGDMFLDEILGPAQGSTPAPAPLASARGMIPDDPFGAAAPAGPGPSDPFGLEPPADPFGHVGATAQDHTRSESDFFSPPQAQNAVIPDDWDSEVGGAPAAPAAPAAKDPFAEPPQEAAPPPPAHPAATVPGPAAPQPPAAASGLSEEAALRAFLSGAGAESLELSQEDAAEVMARLGTVFRAMVAGMREVLMTRASIKGEFRMNQTMIRAGGNNPLKFSISPEQAVEAMIRPSVPGYQDAVTATDEAMRDIKAHEVAMMTGMEAALKHLLDRLDPARLTERIETGSALGSILGGGKKARYWEAYEQMYADIAREAEDDFQAVFGREFARAYEEQLRKL
ncbi:MAG: type VI secretion system-associated FHA domain protein TagH [Pseudomonadota bacterium]